MEQSGGGGGGCRSSNLMMGFGSDNNSNNNNGGGGGLSTMMIMMNMPPPLTSSSANSLHHHHQYHNNNSNNTTSIATTVGYFFNEQQQQNNNMSSSCSSAAASMLRAKIMAHPLYPRLLAAYLNCQKVGAPPEVVARLEDKGAACVAMSARSSGHSRRRSSSCVGVDGDEDEDPALDQFMEAYCEMLIKYEQELTKPFNEAMLFLSKIESQFKALTVNASACGEAVGRNGSSDEDIDGNSMNVFNIDPQAVDRELKGQLLRKYSGYLGSLKQEFLKKKKKGKLPKEATAQLLDWWSRNYKWPYPSEQQKLALAESTGLEPKQINNWFINQRKRHWKPTEEMQFVVMGAPDSHYYLENVVVQVALDSEEGTFHVRSALVWRSSEEARYILYVDPYEG